MDDIVNNRLPAKKLFYSECSDEQTQLVDLIRECVFIGDVRLFLLRVFCDSLEDLL